VLVVVEWVCSALVSSERVPLLVGRWLVSVVFLVFLVFGSGCLGVWEFGVGFWVGFVQLPRLWRPNPLTEVEVTVQVLAVVEANTGVA